MAHPANKPPIARAPLSVALPVRDQASQIDKELAAWFGFLSKRDLPFEFLVIDDGSRDDTLAKAQAFAAKHSETRVLKHDQPRGFGAALRTALERARHPLFFYTSLDYPYRPADLQKLLDRIDEVDIVNGFRAAVPLPPWLAATRKVANLIVRVAIGLQRETAPGWLGFPSFWYGRAMRLLFGVHVFDPESAFKLFRREVFDRIPIQSDGPFAHIEILAKANFLTCWMDEVPIGAQSGASPEALQPVVCWKERRSDMKRVLSRPIFSPQRQPVEPAAVVGGAAE